MAQPSLTKSLHRRRDAAVTTFLALVVLLSAAVLIAGFAGR